MNIDNEQDFAIVVGITNYSKLSRLDGAQEDATKVFEWLIKTDGGAVKPDNAKLILSKHFEEPEKSRDFEAKPVKFHIDQALNEFGLGQKPKVGRRLYFYFAGHGLGPSFDEVVLLMANAAIPYRMNSNIGVKKYREAFRKGAPFKSVIYFLDCCRDFEDRVDGAAPDYSPGLNQAEASGVNDFVVMGAKYGRKTFEPVDPESGKRRGLLTRALLEALDDRKAAYEGRITAPSLKAYLEERVPALAEAHELKQKPDIPDAPSDLVFGPSIAQERVSGRITVSAGRSGELLLFLGNNLVEPVDRRIVTPESPWDVELNRNVVYLVQTRDGEYEYINTRKEQESYDCHFE